MIDLTQGVTGVYTPQKVKAKFVRTMVIAPPNLHYLDDEVLAQVDLADPEDILLSPLRFKDRYGRPVGAVTVE
jgi:hypothetical protein